MCEHIYGLVDYDSGFNFIDNQDALNYYLTESDYETTVFNYCAKCGEFLTDYQPEPEVKPKPTIIVTQEALEFWGKELLCKMSGSTLEETEFVIKEET